MRLFPLLLLLLLLVGSLAASEPAPAYPLRDGVESVADYAKRVDLPPTKTLELGDNFKMELVLIPARKFMIGTPPPMPVDCVLLGGAGLERLAGEEADRHDYCLTLFCPFSSAMLNADSPGPPKAMDAPKARAQGGLTTHQTSRAASAQTSSDGSVEGG